MEGPYKGSIFKAPAHTSWSESRQSLVHTHFRGALVKSLIQARWVVCAKLVIWNCFLETKLHPSFTNAFTKTCGPNGFLLWCQPLAHSLCNCLAPTSPSPGWHLKESNSLFFSVSLKPEQDTCSPLHQAGHRTARAGRVWRILGKQWVLSKACIPLEFPADSAVLRFRNNWRMENE